MTELFEIIRDGKQGLIYEVNGSSFIVGRFSVKQQDGLWAVSNYYDEVQHRFFTKSAAIYYALALMRKKFRIADSLKASDTALQSSKNEFTVYDTKVHRMVQTQDDFKLHLYLCKLEQCRDRVQHAVEEMEKSLKSAKYLNNSGTQPWNYAI